MHMIFSNGSLVFAPFPGPDSIGIVAISHGCSGVAARACGLVGLDPTRVAEILKDRPSWYRDCRAVDVTNVLSTGNGGTIELLYMQTSGDFQGNNRPHV
ncbi:homeobox-leucine zipper protein ATHB-15-like [Gossypium hirsutum]|uniref:Homeobox-leucine zipper protein ATHB-15-like n=1 Tax=Gossypium hirsutum TaxID=3635 RepID=A0ABM2YMW0_GOSHI|nr:homeobox-leucine zipper protein ATHB-15-like [Gossypium hirsutum]